MPERDNLTISFTDGTAYTFDWGTFMGDIVTTAAQFLNVLSHDPSHPGRYREGPPLLQHHAHHSEPYRMVQQKCFFLWQADLRLS